MIDIEALIPYLRLLAIIGSVLLLEEVFRKMYQFWRARQSADRDLTEVEADPETSSVSWGPVEDSEDLSEELREKRKGTREEKIGDEKGGTATIKAGH